MTEEGQISVCNQSQSKNTGVSISWLSVWVLSPPPLHALRLCSEMQISCDYQQQRAGSWEANTLRLWLYNNKFVFSDLLIFNEWGAKHYWFHRTLAKYTQDMFNLSLTHTHTQESERRFRRDVIALFSKVKIHAGCSKIQLLFRKFLPQAQEPFKAL